jgi:hypothetical protein
MLEVSRVEGVCEGGGSPLRGARRAENVAKPFMTRSCGGQSYKVLEDLLIDNVTLSLRFRCLV